MPDGASFFDDLADSLCAAIVAGAANQLLYVSETSDGYDVGTFPLNQTHPASLLMGTDAPPEWMALGVAIRGRPFPLDGDRRRKLPNTATTVVIVQRDGTVVGRMRVGDLVHDGPPAYGLILDCLQRTFGLPTAAPLDGTGARFTATWLENVVRTAATTWPAVVALHPAAQLLEGEVRVESQADLAAAARALERTCDWERLRWLVVEDGWQEPFVTPVDAAWLDAGSFSRFVMADVRPLGHLLAEVRRTVGPAMARRCRTVVHQVAATSRRPAA